MFALLPVSLVGECQISFTYYNNETIPEEKYSDNYLGFRVVTKDCTDVKVMKNSDSITSKEGYNEVGEYKITSDSVSKTIHIKEFEAGSKKDIHITFHMATFSVIQGIQQLIKAVSTTPKPDEIMVYYNRGSTLVKEQVIKHLGTEKVFPYADVEEMKKTILKLYKENPKAFITFYCEDIRCQYVTMFFVNQGIPADRYQIILNSDGSAQYSTFYSMNNDEKWLEVKAEYQKYLDLANVGVMADPWDTQLTQHMFFYATQSNIKITPHTMEYLQTNNTQVKDTIDSMNKEIIDPIRDLKKMPENQQKMYFDMTGVDAEYWKKEYFPKKPMMIIGTSTPDHGTYFKDLDEWKTFLISLLTFYGGDYSVCFKPHPAAKLSDNFRNMMKECNVKIIETQVPGEAIMAALDEVKVGGYFSTIFLSGTPDYIFARDASGVVAFYQPTLKELSCKYVVPESQLQDMYGDDFFQISGSIGGRDMTTEIVVSAVVPIVVLGIVIGVLVFLLIRKNMNVENEP